MKIPTWLLVAGAGILLAVQGRCAGEREGDLRAQVKARETVIAALASRAGATDTAFRRDTLRLSAVRRVTDSLLLIDTLVRTDTFRIWLAGERAACDKAISTCVTQVAQRDSIIANMDTLLRLERKRRPGRFGCVLGPTVDTRGFGLGGSCGFRLR